MLTWNTRNLKIDCKEYYFISKINNELSGFYTLLYKLHNSTINTTFLLQAHILNQKMINKEPQKDKLTNNPLFPYKINSKQLWTMK